MAASGTEVKLLGSSLSPFSMRPSIAFNLKGVRYEFLEEVSGSKSELLLKSNPVYKKIPVLIHDGKPICESMIIVQYIDKVWTGPSILPSDPYERTIARFWAVYIDDKLLTSLMDTLKAESEEATTNAAKQMLVGLQMLEGAFEKCSKGDAFFGGDTIGYLDIALGSYLGWLKTVEKIAGVKILDETKIPLLVKWVESLCSNNAVKELMLETDELVEHAKMLQTKWRAAPTN